MGVKAESRAAAQPRPPTSQDRGTLTAGLICWTSTRKRGPGLSSGKGELDDRRVWVIVTGGASPAASLGNSGILVPLYSPVQSGDNDDHPSRLLRGSGKLRNVRVWRAGLRRLHRGRAARREAA